MDHLKGLLQWYATGLPDGLAFLSSLYACPFVDIGKGCYRYRLTAAARRDLMWWRALMLVAYHHPHVLGVSLNAVRRLKVPTMYMRTDASTTVGGGGLVSLTAGGEPLSVPDDAIRWTAEEMRVFALQSISINTLEYYAAIYFVMLWSPLFVGQIVHLECDNTAAVSWLMKCRANAGNEAADTLAKIFSLFCLKHSITIISTHLRGVDNVIADFRSRDLEYMAQAGDESICRGTRAVRVIHEKGDLPSHTAHLRDVAVQHRWRKDTLSTYGTGFNSWVKYCTIIGVDPECRTKEGEDWGAEELQGHILQYVIIQCGIRSSRWTRGQSRMFTWWASITTSYFTRGREEFFAKASRTTAVKTTLIGFQRLYDKLHPM
jgi:hypothetical protein